LTQAPRPTISLFHEIAII